MEYLQYFTHFFLHLLFPAIVAKVFFKKNWKKAYLLILTTMLVDVDHLLATPVFQFGRCSIGFHPLHSYVAIVIYFLGALFLKGNYRIIAIGLLLHMFTDFQDYYFWNVFLHH